MTAEDRVDALRELTRRIDRFTEQELAVEHADVVRRIGFESISEFMERVLRATSYPEGEAKQPIAAIANALGVRVPYAGTLGLRRARYGLRAELSPRTIIRHEIEGAKLLLRYIDNPELLPPEPEPVDDAPSAGPRKKSKESASLKARVKSLESEVEWLKRVIRRAGLTDE